MLWESSDSDVEVITIFLPNVLDKVDSMYKTSLDCFPFVLALGRVTTEGENIAAAILFRILYRCVNFQPSIACLKRETHPQCSIHFFSRHISTCQMHACFYSNDALACLHHLRGEVGGPATSIPMHHNQYG